MSKEKELNLSKLLAPYKDKWVALRPDFSHVSASGETLTETRSKLSEKEREELYFMRVIAWDTAYEPFSI